MIKKVSAIPSDVWDVILETLKEYDNMIPLDGAKDNVEKNTEMWGFDGGVFLSNGNEFDLYVAKKNRGRWRVRQTIKEYLNMMLDKHGSLKIKIDQRNATSLGLAYKFGFNEAYREGNKIVLEVSNG